MASVADTQTDRHTYAHTNVRIKTILRNHPCVAEGSMPGLITMKYLMRIYNNYCRLLILHVLIMGIATGSAVYVNF